MSRHPARPAVRGRRSDSARFAPRRWAYRRRAARRPEVRDAEDAFRAAISAGVFSAERGDIRWAGRYRYLFHDERGTAWFKRRGAFAYVLMSARRGGCGLEGTAPGERAT
ncbi:MAG: hypothetical protein OXI11_09470 [Gammaproteobacteria bacterium]|nr:hypothetical protein [Gammaproteobacteria bacterium]